MLLKVPQNLIFNTKTALKYSNPSFDILLKKEGISSKLIILALLLIHHKHLENSFFKPYIDILPEKLDGLPYWTDTELSELKESPVWERANSIIQSRKDAFSTYSKIFTVNSWLSVNII